MGAGASLASFQADIEQVRALVALDSLKKLWSSVDFNGNGYCSLAEIDRMVVEMAASGGPFAGFNNKPALMRAYKASCRGGAQADYVEKNEFAYLIRNLFFFDRLWDFFDDVDANDDRRITREELGRAVASREFTLSRGADVDAVFSDMDTDGAGMVLFDEFCVYVANKYVTSEELDAALKGTRAGGKPPRKLGKRRPKKSKTGRRPPPPPEASTPRFGRCANPHLRAGGGGGGTGDPEYDAKMRAFTRAEGMVVARLGDRSYLDRVWSKLDNNGNNKISLAEIDKMCSSEPDWQLCDNKPALMRAYKFTCSKQGGGDGDAYITKKEFKKLLQNLFFFNKMFATFDDIDTGDDRRVDYDEFCEGLDRVKLSDSMDEGAKRAAFSSIDRDGGGKVLFNEFCLWVRKKKLDLYNNPAGKYAASYGSRTPRGGRR